MKRSCAALLLLTLFFFLAVSPWEECEQSDAACSAACHFFCRDACSKVPLTPIAALDDALPGVPACPPASSPLGKHLAAPPELPPPRA